jgi:outer membrane protein OmpA-like peptidoglycan-associated protein
MRWNFCVYLLFFFVQAQAQNSKAVQDSLLDEKQYLRNIKIYQSILKSGPSKDVSLKLADALRHVGKNKESATEYEKVIDKPGITPIHYKNYSEVLAELGDKEESERWALRYKEFEKRAEKISDAHIDVDTGKYFISRTTFNSLQTDFGPSFYKNGILYVSAFSPESKVTVHEGTGESFYYFYYAERKPDGKFLPSKPVFKTINSAIYEGPVALSNDNKTIYLIKSNLDKLKSKSRDKSVKLQLVSGSIVDDEITNILDFEYNDGVHSFSNPSLSYDGNELYFACNMDTVSGSIDIYMCQKENGKWSQPVNLGSEVNSEEDEMFPFISRSGKLYFASQGHGSFGGLDVFMTERENGKWKKPVHLPAPINGIFDDFSLILDEETNEGFLASNRATSIGSDDIFLFKGLYANRQEEDKYRSKLISLINKDDFVSQNGNKIKGKLIPKDPSVKFQGSIVQLLDKNKNVTKRCYVTKDGYFSFSNINPDDYMIVYETERLNAKAEITITNRELGAIDLDDLQRFKIGHVLKDSLSKDKNNFVVGKLVTINEKAPTEDRVSLILVDSSGKVVRRVEVGKNSFFIFRNLPSDNYYILTEDNNPNYTCQIFYHNPDRTRSISGEELGKYHYKHLQSDSMEQSNIILHGQVKLDEPHGILVLLLDSSDKVIDKTMTNKDGFFVFRELNADDMHVLVMNDHPLLSFDHGTVYQEDDSVYHLTKSHVLKKLPYDESSLAKQIVVNGRLTLEGKPLADRLILLVDKNNHVVEDAKTNEDGFFAFRKLSPDDYYFVVDENHPNYLFEKHVNLEDSGLYVYESDFKKLEKKKKEDVTFYSIEGKAYGKSTKKPLENKLVLLLDKGGKVVRQTVVGRNGKFVFTNLPPDNYVVMFDEYDLDQTAEIKVVQDVMTKLVQKEKGKTVTYNVPIAKKEDNPHIFFELRSELVAPKHVAEIKKFALWAAANGVTEIEVWGYADLSGKAEFNLALSEKRIKSCVAILKTNLPASIAIIEKPQGATDQFHNTFGAYIPALNRRVEMKAHTPE